MRIAHLPEHFRYFVNEYSYIIAVIVMTLIAFAFFVLTFRNKGLEAIQPNVEVHGTTIGPEYHRPSGEGKLKHGHKIKSLI